MSPGKGNFASLFMNNENNEISNGVYRAGMAILLSLGVFTRAFRLGHKVLWADEGYDFHYAHMNTLSAHQSPRFIFSM